MPDWHKDVYGLAPLKKTAWRHSCRLFSIKIAYNLFYSKSDTQQSPYARLSAASGSFAAGPCWGFVPQHPPVVPCSKFLATPLVAVGLHQCESSRSVTNNAEGYSSVLSVYDSDVGLLARSFCQSVRWSICCVWGLLPSLTVHWLRDL